MSFEIKIIISFHYCSKRLLRELWIISVSWKHVSQDKKCKKKTVLESWNETLLFCHKVRSFLLKSS